MSPTYQKLLFDQNGLRVLARFTARDPEGPTTYHAVSLVIADHRHYDALPHGSPCGSALCYRPVQAHGPVPADLTLDLLPIALSLGHATLEDLFAKPSGDTLRIRFRSHGHNSTIALDVAASLAARQPRWTPGDFIGLLDAGVIHVFSAHPSRLAA